MKRPPMTVPPRPPAGTRRVPRARTEMAIELVRAEFERARLERELAQLSQRQARATKAVEASDARARALLDRLHRREAR